MSDPEQAGPATEEGEVATSGPEEAKPTTDATASNGKRRSEPEAAGTRNRVKVRSSNFRPRRDVKTRPLFS